MSHLAPDDQVRLARLRLADTTGLYASDEPSTGTAPDGSLSVTIDPVLQVVGVEVHVVDQLRAPSSLDAALTAAYTAALAARLPPPDRGPSLAVRPRPVARRVHRVSAAATPERLNRHRLRYEEPLPRPRRDPVTGYSRNGCVTVTLAAHRPRGAAAVDPGWLAQTSGPRLGAALTEAFLDAHPRKDQP